MKRIKAYCGIGFIGAAHEEEFEFPDDASSEEITEAVDEWAKQFLESWWKEMRDEDVLISRNAAIKAVDRHTREDGTLDDDISVILEEIRAAFDKETVIEELKEAGQECNECNDTCGEEAIEYAVEIVEKGGIR